VKKLLPLALDCVDYHYHYAAAMMAVPPVIPSVKTLERIDPLRKPLVKASSARLTTFTYEILDLLEAGEPSLPEFYGAFRPTGSFAVIYPHSGEVCTESLAEPYYHLLQRLNGTTPARAIAADCGLDVEEAREFLHFAIAEGIVALA
jgi:hypothetical protein